MMGHRGRWKMKVPIPEGAGQGGWNPAEGVRVRNRVSTGKIKQGHRVRTKFSSRLKRVNQNHLFLCFWWRKRRKNRRWGKLRWFSILLCSFREWGGETRHQYSGRCLKGSQEMKSEEELGDCLKIKEMWLIYWGKWMQALSCWILLLHCSVNLYWSDKARWNSPSSAEAASGETLSLVVFYFSIKDFTAWASGIQETWINDWNSPFESMFL